jgi:CubicO group peptidase (beta-lactamase class C family)
MRKRRKATAILTAAGLTLLTIVNQPARAFPRQRPARSGAGEGRAESRGNGATAREAVGQGRALGVRLDRVVAEQVERLKVPGYAVAVIYRGETILQNGYGFADIASGRRPDAQTVFGLASLTKSFTGLAIVMLVESHKLSLDDELGKYLDGLSPEYRRLTIRELATMTAGVPKNVAPGGLTWEQQIRKAQTERLASRPGSAYLYSNLSYRILGDVIEKVSGESYMEFLQKHVLDPLGMTQTGPTDRRFSRPIATPYAEANGRPKPIEYKNPRVNFAAGMLASNLVDLESYTRALLAHDRRLLSPEGYELLWKKRWPLSTGEPNGWAFGWQSKKKQGHWLVTWNGGDPGVASLIEIYPDDQLIVIGLSNEHGQAYSIGHKIANELLGTGGGDEEEEPSGN